jgi:lysophospholipase L1-like esterase
VRRRRLLKRAALIPLGVLLAVAVLEGGLQVAALGLRLTGQALPASGLLGGRRVLCLGDSNTYGLWLADRDQAYPQQLERLWSESGRTPPIEVLNLGYPGTNSSRLRRNLRRMLETFRPDVVVVMIGSNDFWTAPVPLEEPHTGTARVVEFVRAHSRLYQLAYMLQRAHDHRRLEVFPATENDGTSGTARYGDVEFAMGYTQERQQGDVYVRLEENLRAVAADIRAFGAEPVFMTFPSRMWNYGDANRRIRSAAAASGTRLIDLAVVFEPQCPSEPCLDWLFADHHPTALGHHLIAETLVREVAGRL